MTLERILVAYDGSEPAFRALEQAAEVGQVEDAQVDLVIVGTPEMPDPEVIIQQAVGYLCDRGFDPEVHVRFGDPAGSIRRVADEEGYDAVYMGTRGHAGHLSPSSPSVSGAVVELAHVTTVVAH
jgi:nucleotide-binding universal stress UspA family protein